MELYGVRESEGWMEKTVTKCLPRIAKPVVQSKKGVKGQSN